MNRRTGIVESFDDRAGFGTVLSDDGETLFLHCTHIADGSRTIAVGVRVSFATAPGPGGMWHATHVAAIEASGATATRATPPDTFPCAVCGSPVEGEPGQYEICGTCGWEDDPTQTDDPAAGGGANAESLDEARARWRRDSSS